MKTDSVEPDAQDLKQMTIRIPEHQHRRLKAAAALMGLSMEAMVSEALRRTLPAIVPDSTVEELSGESSVAGGR